MSTPAEADKIDYCGRYRYTGKTQISADISVDLQNTVYAQNIKTFGLTEIHDSTLYSLRTHNIFSWLKTGTLQNNEPYQTNVVYILLGVGVDTCA